MKRLLLLAVCIFLLGILLSESGWAANVIYPLPPPNDTSLNEARPQTHHRHTRHHHKTHHRRPHHYTCYYSPHRPRRYSHHRHHYAHHAHRKPSLYLYYALPGTACCGETWQLDKTRCCAQYGTWSSSAYATFEPAADDFIYSASNDDESHYNPYRNDPIEDTIENPNDY